MLISKKKKLLSSGYCHSGRPWKCNENEKIDKYLDLARELRKQWNMGVTVILIVVGACGMVPKGLERRGKELEIRGRIETIQTTALLRSVRILRRVLETGGDLLSLRLV